jgi:hypothetical protein
MNYDNLLQDITCQETEEYLRTQEKDELVSEITGLRKALLECHRFLQETPLEYDGSDLQQTVAELVGDLDGPD